MDRDGARLSRRLVSSVGKGSYDKGASLGLIADGNKKTAMRRDDRQCCIQGAIGHV